MAEGLRRVAVSIFCLVCFLHSGSGTRMSFAAERKLLVDQATTTWCVVKPSTSREKLDEIINFCCTQKGVDCSAIQAGGICYFPPNKVSDASVVMNIYYKLNGKHPFNCYFQGSGLIVTTDPSVDACVYPA